MKYAIVNGLREEAKSNLSGICPACGSPMLPRCGNVRIHHWAHRGKRACDIWWENETEWHRNWKEKFPKDWQECVLHAENGEKHIADVKTDQGWVIEFQHSKLNTEERTAREVFYKKLLWIVDGTRRKRDKSQFFEILRKGQLINKNINLWKITLNDDCALMRDWAGSLVPVFFDFSEYNNSDEEKLWCLFKVVNGIAYIGPFSRNKLIEYHSPGAIERGYNYIELLNILNAIVSGRITKPRQHPINNPLERILRETERKYRERMKKSKRTKRF